MQLLHEFSRYAELIERPVLRQALLNERQYLLSTLHDYVVKLSTSSSEVQVANPKYSTPQIVNDILSIRQLESKVNIYVIYFFMLSFVSDRSINFMFRAYTRDFYFLHNI